MRITTFYRKIELLKVVFRIKYSEIVSLVCEEIKLLFSIELKRENQE